MSSHVFNRISFENVTRARKKELISSLTMDAFGDLDLNCFNPLPEFFLFNGLENDFHSSDPSICDLGNNVIWWYLMTVEESTEGTDCWYILPDKFSKEEYDKLLELCRPFLIYASAPDLSTPGEKQLAAIISRIYINNIIRYGAPNSNAWKRKFWGTLYTTDYCLDKKSLEMSFYTPTYPPIQAVKAFSKRNSDVTVSLSFLYEDTKYVYIDADEVGEGHFEYVYKEEDEDEDEDEEEWETLLIKNGKIISSKKEK